MLSSSPVNTFGHGGIKGSGTFGGDAFLGDTVDAVFTDVLALEHLGFFSGQHDQGRVEVIRPGRHIRTVNIGKAVEFAIRQDTVDGLVVAGFAGDGLHPQPKEGFFTALEFFKHEKVKRGPGGLVALDGVVAPQGGVFFQITNLKVGQFAGVALLSQTGRTQKAKGDGDGGRQGLHQVRSNLSGEGGRLVQSLLNGLGGVGLTPLAPDKTAVEIGGRKELFYQMI